MIHHVLVMYIINEQELIGSGDLFYFLALKIGLAAKVAAIDRISLVFIIILATLLLCEHLVQRANPDGTASPLKRGLCLQGLISLDF